MNYKKTIVRAIGNEVVASVFGLHQYEKNRRGLLDFTGSRYSGDEGNNDRHEAKADVD